MPEASELDDVFRAAGAEFDVPAAVLKAIAWTETRYQMVEGEEELEGKAPAFGAMALAGSRLDDGARLASVTVDDAKHEPLANVRAAAALLSQWAGELGIARAEVASWEPVIERYSGIDLPEARAQYVREQVYGVMKRGLGAVVADTSYAGLFGAEELQPLDEARAAGPDYAGSIWRPSPNYNSRSGVKPGMVVIHTCEGGYAGCWGWLASSKAGASAHYVVREDGKEISQLVRESSRAWHVAATYNSKLNGGVDAFRNGTSSNNFTIGIEHAGFASQKSFPAGQIEASARLVCDMTKAHGIPRDRFHIVGHGKLQPYNRTDPGPNWPWASYIARVSQICGAPPPKSPPPATGGAIVIDSNNANNDATRAQLDVSGRWTASTNVKPYFGTGYWWASTAAVSDGAEFAFYLPAAATKTVDAHWPAAGDRSSSAPFVMFDAQGRRLGTVKVDQRANGGRWNTLGTFAFTAGWNKVVLSRWTSPGAIVVADAVRVR
ncbi:MAG TPA: N-acetylmuramoyl-L-alanine amidase [Gaiellaceae bacterium]|nr:N-acetylmuramoyl-L-alanine amidase [Gaiellaceae bacterium]